MTTGYFNMVKLMMLLLMVITVSSSCKKDKSENCTVSVGNLSQTYKLAAFTYKAHATASEQDYLAMIDACERDDNIRLNSNGTYDNIDVGVTCTPSTNDQGTWSLNGNIITSDGLVSGNIESFDCNRLVMVITDFYVSGDRMTITFQKL
jgi:hypothetical protein